jgi:hypothetical protein
MPEINGFQLREALKRWRIRRDVADKQFKDSLWGFADDKDRPKPEEIAANFSQADMAIARLQELQQQFNSKVTIDVQGRTFTLVLAIKLVGGAGRVENMWRSAATDTGRNERYGYSRAEMTRKQDEEHAQRRYDQKEAIKFSDEAARYASALRAGIATGNAQKITVGEEFAELFK